MLIIFGVFGILLFLGVPVLFALAGSSLAYFLSKGIPAWTIIQREFGGMNSFVQVAVPLFILAGNLMDAGGSLDRIIKFARVTVGRFKGGMAHVNILASMMFAGVTGSAVADVAALGPLEIKMMTDQGYDKEYSTAVTVSSASVGPIIPPSLPLIMYGIVSGTNVGALLIAGFVPGMLIGLLLMLKVAVDARRMNLPTSEVYPVKEIIKQIGPAFSSMSIVIVVMVGIYAGFFTPTEAAGFACLVAFILGKFVYKELKWKDLPNVFLKTAKTLGTCSAIFAIAACFSYVITFENVPRIMSTFLLGLGHNKVILLLLVNIMLLIIGCFMEGISSILIVTPMILPALVSIGVDPVQLGVIMAVNTTLGLLTPPLGLSLFVASSVTEIPVMRIVKSSFPFFCVLLFALFLITYVPQIVLFLPNHML